MPSQVRLSNISYSFEEDVLFNDISFTIEPGRTVFVLGKSGSGKSTLLEMCAGLKEPSAGSIHWDGKNVQHFSQSDKVSFGKKVGFVFQQHALISNMNVFDNLALPLRYHTELSDQEINDIIQAHLAEYAISELQGKLPEALSIGQSRIVAIARALIMKPQLLFLDEPISGLDPIMAKKIFSILIELHHQSNLTILIVNHTINLIERLQCPIIFLHEKNATYYENLEALRNEQDASEFVSYMGKSR